CVRPSEVAKIKIKIKIKINSNSNSNSNSNRIATASVVGMIRLNLPRFISRVGSGGSQRCSNAATP
ncbi:hypothetical protein, partial [Pseudomonas fulva]|uniref:hypothetical protein n=1 Tax=Pseudomonas fulva TaxID=47880 RepID=UPI001E651D22